MPFPQMPTRTVTFENGETYDNVPNDIKTFEDYQAYREAGARDEYFDDPSRLSLQDVDNPFHRDIKRFYKSTIGQPLDFVRATFTKGDDTIGERMEEIRETRATELSEMEEKGEFSYRSLLYADQEEQDLIVDEDGYATLPETLAGWGLHMGSYFAGGYGVARGLSRLALKAPKAFKKLTEKYGRTSAFLKGTSVGIITDQWISNPNEGNVVSIFAKDTGVSDEELSILGEYVQRVTPLEEDSDLEKRFKNIAGNLPIDFIIGIGGMTKYAYAKSKGKLPSQLTADDKADMVKRGLDETRDEVIPPTTVSKLTSGAEVRNIDEFNQVIKQEEGFLGWRKLKQRYFTTRGYNTIKGQDAFEDSMNAQRKTNNQGEHTSLRLKNAIDSIVKSTGDSDMKKRAMDFLTDSRTIVVRDRKSMTKKFLSEGKEAGMSKAFLERMGERQQRATRLKELLMSDTISHEKKISLITKKYNLSEEVAENVLEARLLIDNLSKQIIQSPSVKKELKRKLQANLGIYLNRAYKLFEDGNYNPEKIAMQKAKKHLIKGYKKEKRYAKYTQQELEREADSQLASLLARTKEEYRTTVGKPQKSLKDPILEVRKDIEAPIREVMGEITDPSDALILTVNKMSKLYQRDKFLRDMNKIGTDQGFIIKAKDPRPTAGEWVKIEGISKALDGKLTTPLMKKVLEDQEKYLFSEGYSNNTFIKNFLSAKGFANKAATVFNHITVIRNFLGGAQANIANGLTPLKIFGEGRGSETFKILKNEILKGGNKRLEKLHEEFLELGIINTNVQLGDLRALINEGANASSVDNLAGRIKDIPLVGKPLAGTGDFAEKLYMGIDDFFKINAYQHELSVLKMAHRGSGIGIQDLKKMAAEKVKNTYFNYDRVSKGVKAMRQSPLGSFASFPAEVIRTSGYIVGTGLKELLSGNAVLAARGATRLAGFIGSGTAWAAAAEISKSRLGWSEEQQDAAQVLTETPWSKDSPRIFRTDEEGRIFSTDTKYIDAYNTIKQPLLTVIADTERGRITGEEVPEAILGASLTAFKELASPFVSEAIMTRAITDVYYAYRNPSGSTPDGKDLFAPEQHNLERAASVTGYLLNNLIPGGGSAIQRLVEAETGAVNPYTGRPKRNLEMEIAANYSGVRYNEFNPKEQVEFAITNYNREQRKLNPVRGNYNTTVEDTVNDYATRQRMRYELQQELFRKVKAAQYFLNDSDLRNLFEERNFSKAFARNILDGNFTAETITDSLVESVRKRAVREEGVTTSNIRRLFQRRYTSMNFTNLHMPEEDGEE